ncbi:MAG: ATP-grasp domain-containing protein [Myxococcales bacterium]|nr:ATP-grasp domain-containing protein [Myxococcales bacterium]
MHVVFIEPRFPVNQRLFVHALAEVGVTVSAIGEGSPDTLDPELRRCLSHFEPVRNVTDPKAMLAAVRSIQRRRQVDRLEATVEAHIMAAAHAREAAGIPGTTVQTAFLCRDKPAMKAALRAGGVPCAQSTAAASEAEVRAFIERVGYPVILKPRDGAGAAGAVRVADDSELPAAMESLALGRPGRSVAVEEFIDGHEGFFDTLTLRGEVVHEFASHYYPNVLEAMRERWISPQVVTTNRVDVVSGYDQVKAMARKVTEVLGIETSATHMEWFVGPKGLKFSEIGCRPPGVRTWDLYNAANEMDLYREWAMLIGLGRPGQRPSRRFSAGMIALRPDRDGRIAGYSGVEAIRGRLAPQLIDWHLPPVGTPTQPVEAGFMANAWVRAKHESYDGLRSLLDAIGETIRVHAR